MQADAGRSFLQRFVPPKKCFKKTSAELNQLQDDPKTLVLLMSAFFQNLLFLYLV